MGAIHSLALQSVRYKLGILLKYPKESLSAKAAGQKMYTPFDHYDSSSCECLSCMHLIKKNLLSSE